MFEWLRKLERKKRIARLRSQAESLESDALNWWEKEHTEDQVFWRLVDLCRETGLSPKQAAKTERGTCILSLIVLNRIWAFYHCEQAIQINAELYKAEHEGFSFLADNDAWWQHAVPDSIKKNIISEIPIMSKNVIARAQELLKD
ncbi:MAG: hypothetical protein LBR63_00765 [Citrobacter amalonaticus]|jgi:hypothetical protein|nr:hypothetical protein [Citrobacter amalonaticus]